MEPFLKNNLVGLGSKNNNDINNCLNIAMKFMDNNQFNLALSELKHILNHKDINSVNNEFLASVKSNIGICEFNNNNILRGFEFLIKAYKDYNDIQILIKFWDLYSREIHNFATDDLKELHEYIEYMVSVSDNYGYEQYSTSFFIYYLYKTKYKDLFIETINNYQSQSIVDDFSYLTKEFISFDKNDSFKFIHHPIITYLLKHELIKNELMENFIATHRNYLLEYIVNKNPTNDLNNFIVNLSYQCYLNEYCWSTVDKEKLTIKNLHELLENNLTEKNIDQYKWHIAILGCFTDLSILSKSVNNYLVNYNGSDDNFVEFINFHIIRPSEINDLKSKIISITPIKNTTSLKVKEQYEDRPFPVWSLAKTYEFDNDNFYNQVFKVHKIDHSINDIKNVLIAGCGTGRHTILRAKECKDIKFLSIDISESSLAYATYMAKNEKLDNITFALADINEFDTYDYKFDIIECVGVLHHTEKPIKGLKNLKKLLNDDGFIKLGLYSETSRSYMLDYYNEYIKDNKITDSYDDLVNFRRNIKNNVIDKDSKINTESIFKLTNMRDFYSITGLKDLLFHEQEIRYTPHTFDNLITEAGLKLSKVEIKNNYLYNQYLKQNPNDQSSINIKELDQFEKNNPLTFAEMYILWIKKDD